MSRPLVSVVMALYNGEKYLEAQVASILSQTHAELELLIFDDGSKDSSIEIARSLEKKDARVRLYQNGRNRGLVRNFLEGLRQTKGDYIAFSDQDDRWSSDKLEILVRLSEGTGAALVYSDMAVCDGDLEPLKPSFWEVARIRPRRGSLGQEAILRNLAPGCSALFRRSVCDAALRLMDEPAFWSLNQASVLDETPFIHDHFIFVLACTLGRIDYTPEKLMKYRQHPANNVGAFYEARSGRGRFIELLKKKIRLMKSGETSAAAAMMGSWEEFKDVLEGGKPLFSRLRHLRQFLFMRNDTWRDQFLGLAECVWPSWYERARNAREAKHG